MAALDDVGVGRDARGALDVLENHSSIGGGRSIERVVRGQVRGGDCSLGSRRTVVGKDSSEPAQEIEKSIRLKAMSFNLDTPYYPIPGAQPEPAFGAIMEILLKTRLKLHLETSREWYDEDVNAYLAGLLVSYINPSYLQAISEVLSEYDIDVFQAVAQAEDRYHAYWIYKVNADDLLVSTGLFRKFEKESKGELVRMKRYYSSASEYQKKMYGKPTAVGEIQTKLADRSERYLAILAGARQDYLHFLAPFPLDHWKKF